MDYLWKYEKIIMNLAFRKSQVKVYLSLYILCTFRILPYILSSQKFNFQSCF